MRYLQNKGTNRSTVNRINGIKCPKRAVMLDLGMECNFLGTSSEK